MTPARRQRRGGTAIEFALTFPVFFLLLSGVIDIAWLSYTRAAMDSSNHLGCREGSTIDPAAGDANLGLVYSSTVDAIEANLAVSRLETANATITVIAAYASPSRSLNCKIDYFYEPLVGTIMPSLTLSTTTVVRFEYQR